MRAGMRGTREANLVFSRAAEVVLAGSDNDLIDKLENLLQEDDLEVVEWVTGISGCPPRHSELVRILRRAISEAAGDST